MSIINSPYPSAFTACLFLFSEFNAVFPLMKSDDADQLLKNESVNRHHLMVNNEAYTKKILLEFKRRYNAVFASDMKPEVVNVENYTLFGDIVAKLK